MIIPKDSSYSLRVFYLSIYKASYILVTAVPKTVLVPKDVFVEEPNIFKVSVGLSGSR